MVGACKQRRSAGFTLAPEAATERMRPNHQQIYQAMSNCWRRRAKNLRGAALGPNGSKL